MKIQTFAVVSVAVAALAFSPSVSAAECSDAQLASADTNEGEEFQKACPSLFKDGQEVIDLTDLEEFDAAALTQITPCKEAACTTFLGKLYEKTPDCTVSGLNIKNTYKGLQQVCTKIATGSAKIEDVTGILKGLVSNVTFEDASGSDSEEEGSVAGNATTIKPVPTAVAAPEPTTEATPTSAAPKDASQTTTQAPTATKSDAAAISGIMAAVVSTALATALLL